MSQFKKGQHKLDPIPTSNAEFKINLISQETQSKEEKTAWGYSLSAVDGAHNK